MTDAKLSPRRARDIVDQYMQTLDDLSTTADISLNRTMNDMRKDIGHADLRLRAVSPMNVLERGYSFVRGPDGKALTSVSKISIGSDLEIRMRDGSVKANVKEVVRNERDE
jgi:exodeoxyribonuclease VII large subunit